MGLVGYLSYMYGWSARTVSEVILAATAILVGFTPGVVSVLANINIRIASEKGNSESAEVGNKVLYVVGTIVGLCLMIFGFKCGVLEAPAEEILMGVFVHHYLFDSFNAFLISLVPFGCSYLMHRAGIVIRIGGNKVFKNMLSMIGELNPDIVVVCHDGIAIVPHADQVPAIGSHTSAHQGSKPFPQMSSYTKFMTPESEGISFAAEGFPPLDTEMGYLFMRALVGKVHKYRYGTYNHDSVRGTYGANGTIRYYQGAERVIIDHYFVAYDKRKFKIASSKPSKPNYKNKW